VDLFCFRPLSPAGNVLQLPKFNIVTYGENIFIALEGRDIIGKQ